MKVILFLISYIPLYFGLIFKNITYYYYHYCHFRKNISNIDRIIKSINLFWYHNKFMCIILIFLIIIPLTVFFLYLIIKVKKGRVFTEKVGEYKKTGDTIINYLITYVIPFMSMSVDSLTLYFWGNIILIFVIMILFVKLDEVYLNPPLIVLGFYIFTNEDEEKYYLTRNTLTQLKIAKRSKEYVRIIRITGNFYYIKKINFGE